jgi:tryptophan halogenase
MSNNFSIGIVGSGTAGMIAAIMLRQAFPSSDVTIVSSSKIGIIGVGEGSTEHWKKFMELCEIPLLDLLTQTDATHKYGIRFENWHTKNPDYFHSVSGDDSGFNWNNFGLYAGFIEKNQFLTTAMTTDGFLKNRIRKYNLHNNTNQYHFDTMKLNAFFEKLCFERRIKIIDAEVKDITLNLENGNIESVVLDNTATVEADFWIDATGLKRLLMTKLGAAKWNSFSKYLLVDSAIAFPTESDPSGEIKPYTRARAASSGWIWEIPTQQRRGNGYVFASDFITEEEAINEVQTVTNYTVGAHKTFKFDAGHLEQTWVKNCCAVGLASAFVEPLEATSIGTTIQQVIGLVGNLASYNENNQHMQKFYNKKINLMMDNVLTMIRLHYVSDRVDTPFWRAVSEMPINPALEELLALWSERLPMREDVSFTNGELFLPAHLIHVAQGQDVLNRNSSSTLLERLGIRGKVAQQMSTVMLARFDHETIDHAQSLKDLYNE